MNKSFLWGASGVVVLMLVFTFSPSPAQQPMGVPLLKEQRNSPLEIVSMQLTPLLKAPPRQAPDWVRQRSVAYNLVVRNRATVPVMAWTINFLSRADSKTGTCATRPSFTEPLLQPGETKTVYEPISAEGPTMTPDIDFVMLQNGSYYGKNNCAALVDYTTRLSERQNLFQQLAIRLERDGTDKTIAWVKLERDRQVGPLLSPRKLD